MSHSVPDPVCFASQVVQLHWASKSPMGVFGFHLKTCQGNLPQQTAWNSSWIDYFAQLIKGAMAPNKERNGDWKDLEQLIDRLITHVVPQVLGPLEANGQTVKPTLIHGNLWDENIGISLENGRIYAFDACSHYAHHEMEIAIWRTKSCKILRDKKYLDSYLSLMGISEPVEQFEDRNRIYTCYLALHASACHHGSYFREDSYEHLTYLIKKYAPLPEQAD
ncbi:Fructosamine/Ketosamine-3-kinase [Penicillium malachiteum]|uniref:Fructosamine/Ketosamine-3-kinase n=1 Tax=Penicillium malachiteum TaxID=1324776 RepID=UPI002546DA74|nr:Fructosamine/Ketosamine-3-kinase [Penicillium malachiteum]KAJ5714850.1 Fructosamine/Ketosamine-3-kinase [Penicillium malachiteum]